jgi:nucleoside-diphosphate-sugar epimerase
VIGGAGYIGSVLVRQLLADAYRVRVLDRLLYGSTSLATVAEDPNFEFVFGDTRDNAVVAECLQDVDAVVHLGELVGDPACALDTATTIAINFEATKAIAEQAADYGVTRLVYPSSCSVYGASDEIVDEDSAPNPVSLYAETKLRAEEAIRKQSRSMETIILRLATVFGVSPRPRFDLVVNYFAARGFVDGEVSVHGGAQWRPFVHVADVASCIRACLSAPSALVAGRTFNVGSDDNNWTIGEVAELVRELVPGSGIRTEPIDDHRNYRVSFERVRSELGFEPVHDVRDGIQEILEVLRSGAIVDYRERRFSNVGTLQGILPESARSRVRRRTAEPVTV